MGPSHLFSPQQTTRPDNYLVSVGISTVKKKQRPDPRRKQGTTWQEKNRSGTGLGERNTTGTRQRRTRSSRNRTSLLESRWGDRKTLTPSRVCPQEDPEEDHQ